MSSSLWPSRTIAHQAPLSMEFSRQEYWSGLPCPPPEDLPNSGIKPTSLMCPALAGGFFTTSTTREALRETWKKVFSHWNANARFKLKVWLLEKGHKSRRKLTFWALLGWLPPSKVQAMILRASCFHPKATHGSGLVGERWVGEDNSVVVYLFVKIHLSQDFPSGPVAGTPCSQCRGPRVWSLLRKLRANTSQLKILHATTKKKERKKKIPSAAIKTLHNHLNK